MSPPYPQSEQQHYLMPCICCPYCMLRAHQDKHHYLVVEIRHLVDGGNTTLKSLIKRNNDGYEQRDKDTY